MRERGKLKFFAGYLRLHNTCVSHLLFDVVQKLSNAILPHLSLTLQDKSVTCQMRNWFLDMPWIFLRTL